MTADFAFSSYEPKTVFRLSPESWSFVSFGSPSLSSSSLLTRLRSRGPQNYALQVSFHAVYRRKTCAEIPLPPKFIFKDSLAPTKDATFGQKFQWPQTFSKKCFVHRALARNHDSWTFTELHFILRMTREFDQNSASGKRSLLFLSANQSFSLFP